MTTTIKKFLPSEAEILAFFDAPFASWDHTTRLMSYDAVDVKPIDYDFGAQTRDDPYEPGTGWHVALHPSIEQQIEDLDEETLYGPCPKLGWRIEASPPDYHGDIEITVANPEPIDNDKTRLVVMYEIRKELDRRGIDTSDLDLDGAPEDVDICVSRDSDAWGGLIEGVWGLDPEIWDEDGAFDPAWEPMMNYAYPLPRGVLSRDDWHRAMHNTTVVVIDGAEYLALTGAGMDFSWEICAAYLACGYWPPVHFAADLPRMAGAGGSERDRMILAACRISVQAAVTRAESAMERIDDYIATLATESTEKKR